VVVGREAASSDVFGVRSLTPAAPRVSGVEAERIAAEHYGLAGATATRLSSEMDENFRLDGPGGRHLLKLVPADEPREITDLVTHSLAHVARAAPDLPVQQIVPSLDGALSVRCATLSGHQRTIRVTSFLEGRVLRSVTSSTALREQLGRTLARLGQALRDFRHPHVHRDLSWNLRYAGRMKSMLDDVPDFDRAGVLRASLTHFDERIVPRLDRLRAQPVHNDLSIDNAVIDDTGQVGVIDFGDVVHTQLVNDLAIAAADQLIVDADPLAPALDVACGYLEVEPLIPEELELLYELIRTRVVQRIIGGEWRSSRVPENREYLGRNVTRLWAILERLPADAAGRATARLSTACGGSRLP
jgi:Ser/Thr protein kinase RdoA (MazF antagonist)